MSFDFIDGTIVAYFKAFYIENARQLLKCNGTEHQEGGTERESLYWFLIYGWYLLPFHSYGMPLSQLKCKC